MQEARGFLEMLAPVIGPDVKFERDVIQGH